MINIIKQEIPIDESLKKKLEFICDFCNTTPTFINGSIRKIDKSNLAYVEPHKVIINNIMFLVFNYSNNVYTKNFGNKMKNIIDINNLLPEEIDKTISRLRIALKIVKRRKNTNFKFANNEKEKLICPHRKSKNVNKNSHSKNKVQTYICKDCLKSINKKRKNQLKIFVQIKKIKKR